MNVQTSTTLRRVRVTVLALTLALLATLLPGVPAGAVVASATMTGVAYDNETPDVVEGIEVRVRTRGGEMVATTGPDGRYVIEGLPLDEVATVLFSDPDGQFYGFEYHGYVYLETDTYVDGYLSQGTVLSGTVVDGTATPVEGATVTTYTGFDDVVTGPDGKFAFPAPFPATYRMLSFTPPDGSGLLARDVEYDLFPGDPVDDVVTLQAPGSMSGTVTEAATGDGLDNVEIRIESLDPDCWGCEFYGYTSFDGGWSVSDLQPGDYLVHFSGPWFRDDLAGQWFDGQAGRAGATPVTVAGGGDTSDVSAALAPATELIGTVTALGSYVVQDGWVSLFAGGTTPDDQVASTWVQDGAFSFGGLPAGEYFISVELNSGPLHWFETGAEEDATPVTTSTEAPIEVAIDITDVAVITGTARLDGSGIDEFSVRYQDASLWAYDSTVTDGAGGYMLIVPPGPATISGWSTFHAAPPVEIDPAAGSELVVDLVVSGDALGTVGNPASVVVSPSTDTLGVPTVAPHEAISLEVAGCEGASYGYVDFYGRSGWEYAYADLFENAPGVHEGAVAGFEPGLYDGSVYIECDTEWTAVELGLFAPGSATVVDRAGDPIEGAVLTLSDDGGDALGLPTSRLASITPTAEQTTGPDGMFSWLANGSFELRIDVDGCVTYDSVDGSQLMTDTFVVDCGPLPQDAPGVWGQVFDAEDDTVTLSSMDVTLFAHDDATFEYEPVTTTTTDADGVYAFGDEFIDEFGDYKILVSDPGEGYASHLVYVHPDAAPVRYDLHMSPDVTILTGTVVSADGPVEGAVVQGLYVPIATDETGSFRSLPLPRDRFFYLYVSPPKGSDLFDGYGEVLTEFAEQDIEVLLPTGGQVTGLVKDGSGNPLQGIIVSSSAFGQLTTDASGAYASDTVRPGDGHIVQFYDETGAFAFEWYDDQRSFSTADPISVPDGDTLVLNDAILAPGASIVGTMTAVGGLPLANQGVVLYDDAGEYVADTRTDADGGYRFPGVQLGSYIIGYVGIGGERFPGGTDDINAAETTDVSEAGVEVRQDLTVPGVGFVGGVVRNSGRAVPGVYVELFGANFSWTDSDVDGGYLLPGEVGWTLELAAYAGQFYDDVLLGDLSVAEGEVTVVDIELLGKLPGSTLPPRDGTAVTGSRTTNGLPTLGPVDDVEVTTTACPGGTATFDVVEVYPGDEVVRAGVAMVETASGTYSGSTAPLTPGRVYEIQVQVDCPGDETDDATSFGLYIDPAGTIVDTLGDPIEGATATLYRSDDLGGPYTIVPDGSTIMSPENRTNPDVVGADGVFQWLTTPGYYKVRAEKDGCADPDSDATFVETAELPVPPEQVGLVLVLDCGELPPDTTAPDTTITSGPSGTIAAATAQFTFASNETGSTFQCKLDNGAWQACTSPKSYAELTEGAHSFQVRAKDGAGNIDATPASRGWTVDLPAEPKPKPEPKPEPKPAPTFTDDDTSQFQSDIERLAAAGITKGCNPPANTRFCPDEFVTRGQMAAFLTRALDLTQGTKVFSDTGSSTFRNDIAKLEARGITRGCNPPRNTKFCPEDLVTRGQMAAFLNRAIVLPDKGGPATFTDIANNTFRSDIIALGKSNVTRGCSTSPLRYCPDNFVTRGQMAAFLVRAGLAD